MNFVPALLCVRESATAKKTMRQLDLLRTVANYLVLAFWSHCGISVPNANFVIATHRWRAQLKAVWQHQNMVSNYR